MGQLAVAAIDRVPPLGQIGYGLFLPGRRSMGGAAPRRPIVQGPVVRNRARQWCTRSSETPHSSDTHDWENPSATASSIDSRISSLTSAGALAGSADQPHPAFPRATASSMAWALMASVSWPISALAASSAQSAF